MTVCRCRLLRPRSPPPTGRITLQKVEDACKQAALKALAKHMGDGISAQAAQGPVVSAVLR